MVTTSIKAIVTSIRTGYVVTMPADEQELPEGMERNDSITFSSQCWQEQKAVAPGNVVVLSVLKIMPKGWRAYQARLAWHEEQQPVAVVKEKPTAVIEEKPRLGFWTRLKEVLCSG